MPVCVGSDCYKNNNSFILRKTDVIACNKTTQRRTTMGRCQAHIAYTLSVLFDTRMLPRRHVFIPHPDKSASKTADI